MIRRSVKCRNWDGICSRETCYWLKAMPASPAGRFHGGMETVTEHDLYAAMDWLLTRQDQIERRLAKRHLEAS